MNQKVFLEYKSFLDELSQEEFERIKALVLSSRVYFRDLAVGDVVCPIGEDVRERSSCVSCPLRPECPNFKL